MAPPEKIPKMIENPNTLKLTFAKRTKSLFKKAQDLSILCDAEIAMIIMSNTGQIHEAGHPCMDTVLAKYKACIGKDTKAPEVGDMPELNRKQSTKKVDAVKEMGVLTVSEMLDKDHMAMDLQELYKFEQSLREGLLCVMEKQQIQAEKKLEESLRKQVEGRQAICPWTSQPQPLYVEYPPEEASNDEDTDSDEDSDSDTSLHLGLKSWSKNGKRLPQTSVKRVSD